MSSSLGGKDNDLGDIFAAALLRVPLPGLRLRRIDDKSIRLEGESSIISVSYDWKDRILSGKFRTPQEQEEYDHINALAKLNYQGGGSIDVLFYNRADGQFNPSFDIRIFDESVSVVTQYLSDILTYAPDVLTSTVPSEDIPRREPTRVQIRQKGGPVDLTQ